MAGADGGQGRGIVTDDRAVGMDAHHDFIYSHTSRLLHATPMNIITAKDLDDGERESLLDDIRTGNVAA